MINANAHDLEAELAWFAEVLRLRLLSAFGDSEEELPTPPAPPELHHSAYSEFVTTHGLSAVERLVLILALVPHVRPRLLDVFWTKNDTLGRGYTEFGGVVGSTHGGFIPTGETAVFIVAEDDLQTRFQVSELICGNHPFAQLGVVYLAPPASGEPLLSGALVMEREYVLRFTTGSQPSPRFCADFPARRIETSVTWEDLVLPSVVLEQLDEIQQWLRHGNTLLNSWGMAGKLKPNFTSLFVGPPGTGKTLSASLLGKYCSVDVYKVDLSLVVSKYIGETEKNLSKIFDLAESRRWILFFDEADALFGKRTKVDDSHDRFANQEVSFLLQRIEEFCGVVILASNMKNNIDDAFVRRFHSIISFPIPRPQERQRIWQKAFSDKCQLEEKIDLRKLAERYEVSGGTIMNVVRYASLRTLSRNEIIIRAGDIEEGVRREFLKEGRSL
ncbi:MAG: AAA family ATPase [Myxococcales bacterium]|nr:AAA family ATPase [Myxococcales bacterium]